MPFEPFVEFIRRRTMDRKLTPREQSAVDAFMPMSPNARQNLGGSWGSDSGYRSSGGAAGYRGGIGSDYTAGGGGSYPTSGSNTGSSSGGSVGRGGIGSDFVSGGGSYTGGSTGAGGFRSPSRGDYRSGYGDYGGSNFVRAGTQGGGFNVMPGVDTRQGSSITPRAVDTTSYPGGPLSPQTFRGGALAEDRATRERGQAGATTGIYSPTGVEAARPLRAGAPAGGGAGYGPYGGSGSGGFTASGANQFFDAVMRSEGTSSANHPGAKGYNEVMGYGKYGGYPDKGLTNMTLNEVYDFGQNTMLPNKLNSSAMGAFQITSTNIKNLAAMFGDDMNTVKFDPATQQKYALALATGADGSKLGVKHWEGLKLSSNKALRDMAEKALAQIKAQGFTDFKSLKKFSPYAPTARAQAGATLGTHGTAAATPARVGMMSVPTREQGGSGYAGSAYGGGGSRGSAGGSQPGGGQYGGGYGGGGGFGGGGTYGGSGGGNINQGVGGAYRNR